MNQQDANNQSIMIEDLTTQNAEKIKGGQTREHILLAKQAPTPAAGQKKKKGGSGGGDWNGDGTVNGSDY